MGASYEDRSADGRPVGRRHNPPSLLADRLNDRLSQMGAQVARVVHEVNTPLALIRGSLDNLEEHVNALIEHARQTGVITDRAPASLLGTPSGLSYAIDSAPALLALCRQGTERLAWLSEQLGGYVAGRTESQEEQTADLGSVLEEAVAWAGQGRSNLAAVHVDAHGLPLASGSPDLLRDAFVNLLRNACDAVAGKPSGEIWLTARLSLTSVAHARCTRWLEVRVRDNGPGVPAGDRDRIFEAFFTTKSRGRGLGLGLAITREILESQQGSIALVDSAGEGAEFVVRLRIAERVRGTPALPSENEAGAAKARCD